MFFCSSCTIFLTQITNAFKIGRINKSFDVTLVLSFHWSRDDLLINFQWNTTSFRTSDIWHFACLKPWVSKPECTPSLACFVTHTQQNPQIHLWCDTCWPLGSQHCSWAIPIHILANKHWWGSRLGSIVHTAVSHCETRQTLYRLSYADSASWCSNLIWILYVTVCKKHEVPSSSGSKVIAQIKTQAQLKTLLIRTRGW